MKTAILATLATLATLSSAFATPLKWTCDWPEAKAQAFTLYQGENATFEPTFRVNGRVVTNATIEAVWYQTNGMDQAWWKLDGNTFAPSNDVGASAYRFFVEAKTGDDTLYRANGTLRMLPSPGFTPNALPLPVEQGALKVSYVAAPFDQSQDYSKGDVVEIGNRFYVFKENWSQHQSGSPVESECVDELTSLKAINETILKQSFLPLGYGGTNAAGYKKIDTGWDNLAQGRGYLVISPYGWEVESPLGEKAKLVNSILRYEADGLVWDVDIRKALTTESTLSMSQANIQEEFKKSPTSPYYVHAYLTNNYLTADQTSNQYLKKTYAANTYLTETAADGKYSTSSAVASSISAALGSLRVTYLYNSKGNYRLDYAGKLQRQKHNGYNVNWTNETSGLVLVYANPNKWTCNHPQLGTLSFTRSNGVVACDSMSLIRCAEEYEGATIITMQPLGTFRAVPNEYGSLTWEDCRQFADASDIDYTTSNATLVATIEETECDPSVHEWAKAASKPTYSWSEIADKPAAQINANTATNEMQEAAISSLSSDNESTRAIVMSWENFLDGSNVVFSITNYLSGAYSLDAAKFRVLELHNGAYNETYNSRDEIILHINHFKTNDFAIATNQVIGAVNEAISTKADKAWGKYSSDGQNLQDVSISNTVYMTAPNTVFAGGLGYERVAVGQGAVCVLTTRGAPVWTQGDEGTFKFQDDGGTNYFGFAKTDSYTIGANTDGIDVANNIVTLTYDITMSGVPCVWYKSELSPNTPWEQLNLPDGSAISGASVVVTWDEYPPAGQEICYINCGNSPRGFFKATIEVAGDSKFMTNMRADLSGGIVCTNTAAHVNGIVKPTFNGSTVNWTWSAQ